MNIVKRFLKRKDYLTIAICLTLAISLTIFIIWPQTKEFTAVGDIVAVQEIGIDGSVHFTYVESGITANRYEEFVVLMNYNNPSFVPLSDDEINNLEVNYLDETDEYKEATIENAVIAANLESDSKGYQDNLSSKIEDIMEYSEGFYGNSIGLMTGIGLMEELYQKDYSKHGKYVIAGTGTIEVDQTVGSVSAIREKLLTASQNNVDYFFVPKDKDYYWDESYSNEIEAEKIVKEENLQLQIVPVETLQEAIGFLEKLP